MAKPTDSTRHAASANSRRSRERTATMSPGLAAHFETAASQCRVLSREQAWHFVEHGHVVVPQAFDKALAEAVREQAWRELEEKHGARRGEPDSWGCGFQGRNRIPGYARTAGSGRKFLLSADAPTAFQAIVDVVGGAERLPDDGAKMSWSDAAVANLGVGRDVAPDHAGVAVAPPGASSDSGAEARRASWHKDGWHFRHFLDSPEQGLLVVPIFSDIQPQSGGTPIATDSIAPVARLLAANPQGFHADSVQGAGYLIPGLVEQCSSFAELVGEAGDLAILHPYMLHRPCLNPSPRPRFIANAALVLEEPMRFDRPQDDACSLVELAVLRALGVSRQPFANAAEREAVVPGPFRDDAGKAAERKRLEAEMRSMATRGVVTPAWGAELGYMSNRPQPTH